MKDMDNAQTASAAAALPSNFAALSLEPSSPPISAVSKILAGGPKSTHVSKVARVSKSAPTTPRFKPQHDDSIFSGAVHTIKNNMSLFLLHPIEKLETNVNSETLQGMRAIVGSALMTLNHIEGKEAKNFSLLEAIDLGVTPQLAECSEKGIRPTINTNGDAVVAGSQYEYASALTVLVNNAHKYGFPDGHIGDKDITITIDVQKEGPDARKVITTVSDTGAGMAEHKAAELFTPKAKAARASKDDASVNASWGLGLPTIARTIKGYGSIKCQSTPGKGTSFTMVIEPDKAPERHSPPLSEPQLEQVTAFRNSFEVMKNFLEHPALSRHSSNGESTAITQEDVNKFNTAIKTINTGIGKVGRSIDEAAQQKEIMALKELQKSVPSSEIKNTILVVEDSIPNQKIAALTLKTLGYEVVLAASGEEAIQQYTRNETKIGLVVLDLHIKASEFPKDPSKDAPKLVSSAGTDVFTALVGHGYNDKGRCVPHTGNNLSPEENKSLTELGIRAELAVNKPIDRSQLLTTLVAVAAEDPRFLVPSAHKRTQSLPPRSLSQGSSPASQTRTHVEALQESKRPPEQHASR